MSKSFRHKSEVAWLQIKVILHQDLLCSTSTLVTVWLRMFLLESCRGTESPVGVNCVRFVNTVTLLIVHDSVGSDSEVF